MTTIMENNIGQQLQEELHAIKNLYPQFFRGAVGVYGLPLAHLVTSMTTGNYISCAPLINPDHIEMQLTSQFRFVLLFSDVTVKFAGRFIDLTRGDMFACTQMPEMYSRENTFGLLEIYIIHSEMPNSHSSLLLE
jgi:hypothetical protein